MLRVVAGAAEQVAVLRGAVDLQVAAEARTPARADADSTGGLCQRITATREDPWWVAGSRRRGGAARKTKIAGDGRVIRALSSGEVPVVRGDEPDAQHGRDRVEFEGGAQVGEGLGFDAGAQDGGVGVVFGGD